MVHETTSQRLRLLKEKVIERWKARVCREIPAAKNQTNTELRNSIPKFMDKLCDALATKNYQTQSKEVEEVSQDHGEQRAGLPGYSIIQILKEYKILREIIIRSLEDQGPITNNERDIILTSIEEGMAEAGYRFQSLCQREESTSRIILDGIKDHAIIRSDTEGFILDWNSGAEKIFGWKKEDVLGKNVAILFTPEDVAKNVDKNEKETAAREGKAEDTRWQIRKDGSRFLANGIMNSLIDLDDNIFGFIKVLRDDTEKIKIEAEAKDAQRQLDTAQKIADSTLKQLYDFFDQSPTAMVILEGPDHFIKLANRPYEKLVGRIVNGKTVSEAFSEEEVKYFIPMLDNVYKTGRPYVGRELPLVIPDEKGENINHWVNVNYFPHFDENGKVKGILCDVHEVTDEVKAKKNIEESEKQFRTLANSLPQIIWTSTPDGDVDWYSEWWYKYLGLPETTKWDDEATSPMHPEDVKRTWPIWSESLRTGKNFYMEQRFRRGSDGQYRWHLVRGVPIKNVQGEIVKWVGANTDIHDHKILLQTLEEERELRERFVAALSHDLRTPLTSARLSAQVMRKSYAHEEKVLRMSDRIVANIDRVDGMIQDLLNASRLRAGEEIPLNREHSELLTIIHNTIEELRHVHGNRFEIVEKANRIEGNWDVAGIRRILENLCNNAVKYGDGKLPITIRVECSTEEIASFSVHNFGRPIPSEDLENLFEPFKRASDAQESDKKGWGIGLMLVKGVVDAHGGAVEVTSSEKEGTTFQVKLPVKISCL